MDNTNTQGGTTEPPQSNIIVPKVMAFHPKIAESIPKVIAEAKLRGIGDICIAPKGGVRSAEEQAYEYSLGRTVKNPDGYDAVIKPLGDIVTNAQPWTSWHCYGLAVDLCFLNSHGIPFWPLDTSHIWLDLANAVKTFGFEWGGNWTGFKGDLDHFQMRGSIPNVHEAKRILFEEGLDRLWSMI